MAVSDGTISMYLGHLLQSRVAKRTYGSFASVSLDPSNPEHHRRSQLIFFHVWHQMSQWLFQCGITQSNPYDYSLITPNEISNNIVYFTLLHLFQVDSTWDVLN